MIKKHAIYFLFRIFSRETLDCLVLRIAEILKDEITRSGIRERRPREGETELKLLVQSSQAGAIIGTRGTAVRTLREVSTRLKLVFIKTIKIRSV